MQDLKWLKQENTIASNDLHAHLRRWPNLRKVQPTEKYFMGSLLAIVIFRTTKVRKNAIKIIKDMLKQSTDFTNKIADFGKVKLALRVSHLINKIRNIEALSELSKPHQFISLSISIGFFLGIKAIPLVLGN
jgi:hypothetical protein